MEDQGGHTLIELIITLSILGFALAVTAGLGYSVTEGNARRAAEAEYEQVLDAVLKSRDAAMMSGDNYGTKAKLYGNRVDIVEFDPGSRSMVVTASVQLRQCRITWNLSQNEIIFSGAGVVNRGGTITFYRNDRPEKYLIIQPVTGRIYLSDKNTN
ncbi:type II secretion system protein [Eubacterium sp. 1001713B170207_170306_E7]|uniref:pilus assembly FimT family protein n=1 Tax=Eubacterium sp. 1001713B170207_170306_E7 TaxID=2787097 RepID=UPI00189AA14F|nr:type II secretion system protein [Eubacterium sp. 1001713B170207_170306_E7]